jgi:hypothetical protein
MGQEKGEVWKTRISYSAGIQHLVYFNFIPTGFSSYSTPPEKELFIHL